MIYFLIIVIRDFASNLREWELIIYAFHDYFIYQSFK